MFLGGLPCELLILPFYAVGHPVLHGLCGIILFCEPKHFLNKLVAYFPLKTIFSTSFCYSVNNPETRINVLFAHNPFSGVSVFYFKEYRKYR